MTGIALLALALGAGGATAVLSIARSLLYEHLPYADPDRLFVVWGSSSEDRRGFRTFSTAEFEAYLEAPATLGRVAAFDESSLTWLTADEPVVLRVGRMTRDALDLAGIQPVLGRGFGSIDDAEGNVAMLSLPVSNATRPGRRAPGSFLCRHELHLIDTSNFT